MNRGRFIGRAAATISLALAPVLAPHTAWAQGCSMCKSVVQQGDPLARALNLSVALMVLAPFAVAGSIGGWLFYTYRHPRPPIGPRGEAEAGGGGAGGAGKVR